MMNCDVSIECAHIYADESLTCAHAKSIAIAQRESRRWRAEGRTVRSVVLVDDIHVGASRLTPEQIKGWAARFGFGVDVVVEESALKAVAKGLIKSLPRRNLYWEPFRRAPKRVLFLRCGEGGIALGTVVDRCFEPSCALLVAAWNLTRLGAFSVGGIPTAEIATSVLEERYRGVEMKALRIIEGSRHRSFAGRISHIYY